MATDTRVCLQCDGTAQPRDCRNITSCGAQSDCYLEQIVTNMGTILYNTGCESKQSCVTAGRRSLEKTIVDRDRKSFVHVTVCRQCCHGDLCNAAGCGDTGYPNTKGPVCYACDRMPTPDACATIRLCEQNEECFVEDYMQGNDRYYRSGCRERLTCLRDAGKLRLIGRDEGSGDSDDDMKYARATTVCDRCCRAPLCNKHACPSDLGTTTSPTVTTTTTTTAPSVVVPVDGQWGTWGQYGPCQNSFLVRHRKCDSPAPANGGKPCPGYGIDYKYQPCTMVTSGTTPSPTVTTTTTTTTTTTPAVVVPVDGQWGTWGQFGPCQNSLLVRHRKCDSPAPTNGGKTCPGYGIDYKYQPCTMVTSVAVDGGWSKWSAWSTCPVTCGTGTQLRSRSCTNPTPANGGQACTGPADDIQPCAITGCSAAVAVDGDWSSWSVWSSCPVTCGLGQQHRSRSCTNPAPANGGQPCTGQAHDNRDCTMKTCPVDGGWTAWSAWAPCMVTCGSGPQYRSRACTSPSPASGGHDCTGSVYDVRPCTVKQCPVAVDGDWSTWTAWSTCPVTCGTGKQSRSRSCTNPTPANGGQICTGHSSVARGCARTACPVAVDGDWSTWTAWSTCPVTCGTGKQNRARSCTNPTPANGGQVCSGHSSVARGCARTACPVDGAWSAWTVWSSCPVTCGSGTQQRSRTCTNPTPANGGQGCAGQPYDAKSCTMTACSVDGGWSTWSVWSSCPVTCGSGTQHRSRTCTNPTPANGGQQCSGQADERQACAQQTCKVDGGWTAWSAWLPCMVTCGSGPQYRSRACSNPSPASGGQNCSGSVYDVRPCTVKQCPAVVDGDWSTWSVWSSCPVTCGTGTQYRSRSCTNPTPANGGQACSGHLRQEQSCAKTTCPVALSGGWSTWTHWSACPVTCGTGTQLRSRTCTNPTPASGGQSCSGPKFDIQPCATNACNVGVDGGWTDWSAWGHCAVTCGTGTQHRSRTCTNPAPANGGQACPGHSNDVQPCSASPCQVDGSWSRWSPWTTCSVTCGAGVQKRGRVCIYTTSNKGRPCTGPSEDTGSCLLPVCPVDGGWTQWSPLTACSATCGTGTRQRSRTCTNPAPANGGQHCSGQNVEKPLCSNPSCPPPVDGHWSSWGPFQACSETKPGVVGKETRHRYCDNPAPANGGQDCAGVGETWYWCNTNQPAGCKPPVILYVGPSKSWPVGADVVLVCEAIDGTGLWEPIKPNMLVVDGHLRISNFHAADAGNYTCTVTNPCGGAKKTVKVAPA